MFSRLDRTSLINKGFIPSEQDGPILCAWVTN